MVIWRRLMEVVVARSAAVISAAGALLLVGCARGVPAGPPVQVEASQVEPQIYWSSALQGRRVSIDGYIGFDNGPDGRAIAMGPQLFERQDAGGQALIRFDARPGVGPNQLNLPEIRRERVAAFPNAPETVVFDMRAATYQDGAGASHHLDERVRVSGRLTYVKVRNLGLWSDPDPRSPTGRRLKPSLTDVTFEVAR